MKNRIDWEQLEEDLRKELSNEKIWEMGYGDDPRNPHTTNILFLEQIIDRIFNGDYDEAISQIEGMYGLEYFDDYKLEQPSNPRSYDIDMPSVDRFGDKLTAVDFDSIMEEFAQEGFNVTWEALFHNYSAWLDDLKSGYRDEKNGYHLFSPCGCNPLSFRVSELRDDCSDWQTTYEW